jgi:hypothetical protein
VLPAVASGRLRRLTEELEESGLVLPEDPDLSDILIDEIDHALRPPVHERRVVSSGTIIEPTTDPSLWEVGTQLEITRKSIRSNPLDAVRRFADGLSSWILRSADGTDDFVVFDRPAGSERDMVVLSDVMGATLIQRHPAGWVRVAGSFGVLRWAGLRWHHEPPVRSWIDSMIACPAHGDPEVLEALLAFAVHDLGSLGIGALLIHRTDTGEGPAVEERLPTPPPLDIRRAAHLGPLRHALAQIDGAAIFDSEGLLRQLGVRLIPSVYAEATVEALGGTRHTSGRRYSRDDPRATIIAISEDGPVSVLRDGKVLGSSLLAE